MKRIAPLLSLLLAGACASPTAVIDKRTIRCGPGQDLTIAAAFENGRAGDNLGEQLFLVEVSNNGNTDATVTVVRVEPGDRNRVRFNPAYQSVDVTIAGGDDHVFRLPATEASVAESRRASEMLDVGAGLAEVMVTVTLANGDTYRCPFRFSLR
ncbi:MAG TPA: hypothetical protein VND45_05270 [Thermoanaerobaculia bacterium]|jgi:hypothetical protein|nr:hypothetical protein [Thermoanaerobaculia bacterium]